MSNVFNKKLAELMGKMDEKMIQAKLNAAMDMLKKGNADELAKKINKIDKDELMAKINEFDESKLRELKINKEEIRQKVSEEDLQRLALLMGDSGELIVAKIKEFLK